MGSKFVLLGTATGGGGEWGGGGGLIVNVQDAAKKLLHNIKFFLNAFPLEASFRGDYFSLSKELQVCSVTKGYWTQIRQ